MLLALLATPILLALLGERLHTAPASPLEALDTSQQRLFIAQPDGSIRVLKLQRDIAQLASLRAPQRRKVLALQLSPDGRSLLVEGDDAHYRYDARSLRLLAREEPRGSDALALGQFSASSSAPY